MSDFIGIAPESLKMLGADSCAYGKCLEKQCCIKAKPAEALL